MEIKLKSSYSSSLAVIMDRFDQKFDDIRQNLKGIKGIFDNMAACAACATECLSDIINGNEISETSNNKSETSGINEKLLAMQLELVVNEKDKIEKKLVAVEMERDNFERELRKLKSRYEKQETKLEMLRLEVESMNQRKKDVLAKFYLVKSQESVHDAVVGSLKRQFEEQIIGFLSGSASGNEASSVEPTAAGSESTNMVVIPETLTTGKDQVAGSTSDVTGQITDYGSHSMKNISDRNHSQNFDSILQCKTQGRLMRLPMARSSGTSFKRWNQLQQHHSQVTTTKTAESRKFVEIKQPSNAVNKRKAAQAIVEGHGPKRTLRCTVCSKQYVSEPSQALCYCQYKNQSD